MQLRRTSNRFIHVHWGLHFYKTSNVLFPPFSPFFCPLFNFVSFLFFLCTAFSTSPLLLATPCRPCYLQPSFVSTTIVQHLTLTDGNSATQEKRRSLAWRLSRYRTSKVSHLQVSHLQASHHTLQNLAPWTDRSSLSSRQAQRLPYLSLHIPPYPSFIFTSHYLDVTIF